MKRLLILFSVALTLTMPCLTWRTACAADTTPAQRDSVRMLLVRENTIRRATAVIDSLDLRLKLALNGIAYRDSLLAQHDQWWRERYQNIYEWGVSMERRAESWWSRNESAFWGFLGMLAAAWALN